MRRLWRAVLDLFGRPTAGGAAIVCRVITDLHRVEWRGNMEEGGRCRRF